jgi:hypothetical protein
MSKIDASVSPPSFENKTRNPGRDNPDFFFFFFSVSCSVFERCRNYSLFNSAATSVTVAPSFVNLPSFCESTFFL